MGLEQGERASRMSPPTRTPPAARKPAGYLSRTLPTSPARLAQRQIRSSTWASPFLAGCHRLERRAMSGIDYTDLDAAPDVVRSTIRTVSSNSVRLRGRRSRSPGHDASGTAVRSEIGSQVEHSTTASRRSASTSNAARM